MKISDKEIAEAIRNSYGIITTAREYLKAKYHKDISRPTLYKRIRNNAKLAALREEMREELLDIAEYKLHEMIQDGDKQAIFFYLKTIGRDRGYSERTEINTPVENEKIVVYFPDNGRDPEITQKVQANGGIYELTR